MAEFSDFGRRMRARGKNVVRNADRLVRRCALAADQALVVSTPVDTGRARSNWLVSLDQPVTSPREEYFPGAEGSTGGPNAQAAIDQGRRVIETYDGDSPGASIYIANNLPYIGRLNEGWSAQAPAGFVEQAVMLGIEAVRTAGGLVDGVVREE